ncbi:MAG: hypothetical protein ACI8ZF_000043 [Candidatus Midichloriaceae bacterium]|jgi:hypothetical protein
MFLKNTIVSIFFILSMPILLKAADKQDWNGKAPASHAYEPNLNIYQNHSIIKVSHKKQSDLERGSIYTSDYGFKYLYNHSNNHDNNNLDGISFFYINILITLILVIILVYFILLTIYLKKKITILSNKKPTEEFLPYQKKEYNNIILFFLKYFSNQLEDEYQLFSNILQNNKNNGDIVDINSEEILQQIESKRLFIKYYEENLYSQKKVQNSQFNLSEILDEFSVDLKKDDIYLSVYNDCEDIHVNSDKVFFKQMFYELIKNYYGKNKSSNCLINIDVIKDKNNKIMISFEGKTHCDKDEDEKKLSKVNFSKILEIKELVLLTKGLCFVKFMANILDVPFKVRQDGGFSVCEFFLK